jgi:chromosome segregation ATPase
MRRSLAAALKRVLRSLRLAPASEVDAMRKEVESLRERTQGLRDAIDKARADATTWKTRAEQYTAANQTMKESIARLQSATEEAARDLAHRQKQSDRMAEDVEHWKARADEALRWKTKAQEHVQELRDLKARIDAGDRAVQIAGEQLMAIEVKLDIVEGAINVLDLRTREPGPAYDAPRVAPATRANVEGLTPQEQPTKPL